MKKSNKILIAFAVALIFIPLLGMIYVAQVKYKTGNYNDELNSEKQSEKKFNLPTENMESIAISTAFETVNIADAKKLGIHINLVNDINYGVKVLKKFKDSIDFKVDASGTLQIKFNIKNLNERHNYTTIIVYGKKIKQVNVTNAENLFFDATADSIALNVKKSASINLDDDVTLNLLNITTDKVGDLNLNKIAVKSLILNLTETNFKSEESSYNNLSITTTGKAEIEINGSDNGKNYFIKNLFINTLGTTNFKIKNIKVEKCLGNFSDETTVNMPAINLKQMYKK